VHEFGWMDSREGGIDRFVLQQPSDKTVITNELFEEWMWSTY
jgi:hypothetical protein